MRKLLCVVGGILVSVVMVAVAAQAQTSVAAPAASPKPMVTKAGSEGHHSAAEAAIRKLDADWLKAAVAKNADKAASFYAPEAVLLVPGAPISRGLNAIRAAWSQMVSDPQYSLTFTPSSVHASGGMAYELGDYSLTLSNVNGQPTATNGKYVVVWVKQRDGSWKVAVDCPTTTIQ